MARHNFSNESVAQGRNGVLRILGPSNVKVRKVGKSSNYNRKVIASVFGFVRDANGYWLKNSVAVEITIGRICLPTVGRALAKALRFVGKKRVADKVDDAFETYWKL